MKHTVAALAFVLGLASQAFAQKGGGFGDRDRGFNRIDWLSIDKVVGGVQLDEYQRRVLKFRNIEPVDKKYVFVYVRPEKEDKEPNEFSSQEMVTHSNKEWAFVKMDLDRENLHPQLKAWGVKTAPTILGCDLHLNDFGARANVVSTDQLRRIITSTPELITRYQADLQRDFKKATELLGSDEARALPMLVKIVQSGKTGYKEVSDAAARLSELGDAALRRGEIAESLTTDQGFDYYDELSSRLKGTPPGVLADIRAARLDHDRGHVKPAILRLQNIVTKSDPRLLKNEIEAAAKALEDLSRAGEAKLEVALTGDKALAREAVKKLAADYQGTEAGKRASEALKRLE